MNESRHGLTPYCWKGRHEACKNPNCECPCHDSGVREPVKETPPANHEKMMAEIQW